MTLQFEFAFLMMDLAFLIVIACNRVIFHLLKKKVSDKLLDLIDIVSYMPIIPVYWAKRQRMNTASSKDISFYINIFLSII